MSQLQPFLTIVMPAYNDADALAVFLPQVLDYLDGLEGHQQVIIVDDGSTDDIKTVFDSFSANSSNKISLSLIRLSRNFGKEAALSAGLDHSEGRYTAMIDADGQHPLSVLDQMLNLIISSENSDKTKIDMVAGIQANRPHESQLAKTLKSSFYLFIQDTKRYEIRPNAGDFRVMNRKVLQALLSLPERQRFMKGLYAWVGFNTLYLPFTADMRGHGDSKFNFSSLFELALVGITSFSQKPLRLISRMGFIVSLLAILYGIYIVMDTLIFGSDVPGWATVAAGIMFSTGIQLICIGVIGEYVGRLYEESKQRPIYLINEIIRDENHLNNASKTTADSNFPSDKIGVNSHHVNGNNPK